MKKIILIIAVLLCFVNTYAQDTKPTKQETMDWIAEKFKDYINSSGITSYGETLTSEYYFYFDSYKNGIITLKMKTIYKYRSEPDVIKWEKEIIDLNNLEKQVTYENAFVISGVKIMRVIKENGDEKYSNNFELYAKWKDGTEFYRIKYDNDLKQRFEKAFQNLADINNSTKPTEKF